jgi:hypothetical protein
MVVIMLDVKDILNRYSIIKIEIKYKRELLQYLQYYKSFTGKSSSARSSISNLENYISKSIEKLISTQKAITQTIKGLKNPKYSNLLTLRCLDNYTWDQIADEMYFTCQWVQELHKRALIEFEKQIAA